MATVRKKHASRQDPDSSEQIVEQGDIYFAYRPRIEEHKVEGLSDIQRFFMVLKPAGGGRFRLAVLGRKRLPDADDHERVWGFIDKIAKSGGEIEAEFKEQHYGTKTRGERTLPSVRPVGEGAYALLQRGRNLHLTYELELPRRPGKAQEEMNIPPQAAYVLSIRNPEAPSPPGAGLPGKEEAHYPKSLQHEFGGRRFATEDPRLLDYEGAEFILIGARTDPERAYQIDIETEHETGQKADVFRQLKMSSREHPLEPLLKGELR